jgi:myosin heavy subunit
MMKLAFQEMKLTLIDFNLKLLGMQKFLAVGPMEKFYQTQINSLEKQKKELKSTMELENKNRQASLAHENELKRLAREKEKQKEAAKQAELDKRAEAVKTEAQEIASAIKSTEAQEEQWAKESAQRDKEGKEALKAEEKREEEAKKKREQRMKDEFERRKKMREDDLRDQLAKAKEAAKVPDPLRGMAGFAQGFDNFRERMKQRKEGFANTKEVAKRFERLKAKSERGTKLSRQDREWLKALGEFNRERKAMEAAKKKAELIQEQIKTLLEKNLQGADNGR